MSWTISTASVKKSEVAEALDKAEQSALDYAPFDSWDDDIVPSIKAAKAAAVALVADGELGDGPFSLSLNGHQPRNKGETPTISVNVVGAAKK